MKRMTKIVFGMFFMVSLLVFTGKNFSKPEMPNDEDYALATDKLAAPVGGVDGLMKKIYSETSLKGKVKGKCYLLVYVNASGGVDDVKIVKGFGGKESDAVDVVKATKFSPGVNGSSPVKSKIALALSFD